MPEPRRHRAGRLSLAGTFVWAALRYWLTVFPRVASELRHWRRSASRIEDPGLRQLALASLAKRGNMEGAAAFATFVPWRARGSVIGALVAFQAIYNYADLLAEQPSAEPVSNARDVHQALLMALDPTGELSLHESHPAGERVDRDFLAEMIEACETASWRLPSYGTVAATVCRAAERIVTFQSLSLGRQGELESWAERQGPANADFAWWEVAAAAGSSLSVHALLAAAASPALTAQDVATIEALAARQPCRRAGGRRHRPAATARLLPIATAGDGGSAAAGNTRVGCRARAAGRSRPRAARNGDGLQLPRHARGVLERRRSDRPTGTGHAGSARAPDAARLQAAPARRRRRSSLLLGCLRARGRAAGARTLRFRRRPAPGWRCSSCVSSSSTTSS